MRVKKRWQGLHSARYRREPLEQRFAEAWQRLNEDYERYGRECLIAYMLSTSSCGVGLPDPVTPRDQVVANTVIQWLGSSEGQRWLKGVTDNARSSG